MFNATNELILLLSNKELSDAIHLAFRDTFNVIRGDLKVSASSITTKTNSRCAIYKFYHNHELNSELFTEQWLHDVFAISDEPQDSTSLNSFRKFLPYIPNSNQAAFTKAFFKPIKSGLRVFFYALYARKAILLPTSYAFPKSSKNRIWFEHAIEIYPELLALFRNCFMNKSSKIDDLSEYLPDSDNTYCRDYAYKIFIASTWYTIEDIDIDEVIAFSKAMYQKKIDDSAYHSPHYSLPFHHVLTTLYRYAPERCNFDIDRISFLLNTNRSLTIHNIDDLLKNDNNEKASTWIELQRAYLKYRSRNFMSTERNDTRALGLLNKYLFVDLFQSAGDKAVPSCPIGFNRIFIDGNQDFGGNIPSLLTSIKGNNGESSYYNNLKSISLFFEWLEEQKGNEYTSGFINPISKLDFPLSKKNNKGTNKKIFPSRCFAAIHSLVHALCEFFYYLIDSGKYERQLSYQFSYYDTQKLGFTPIYYNSDGKIIPIKAIPSRLLTNVVSKRDGKLYDYPCFQGLFLLAVALETGLRHRHIRWLDRDTFDKHLKDETDSVLSELNLDSDFIEVSTDKVKKSGWTPFVSSRVIKLLKRLKSFQDSLDIVVPELAYNGYKNSPYKKIRPLFHLASVGDSKPFSYSRTVTLYRNIQLFFDLHVAMKKVNAKPLNPLPESMSTFIDEYKNNEELYSDSKNQDDLNFLEEIAVGDNFDQLEKDLIKDSFSLATHYETDYTPHGTRSSVISEKIKVLPPWVIAEFISGHESLAVLHHYVQLDKDDVLEILESQSQSLRNGNISTNDDLFNFQNTKSIEVNTKLKKVVDTEPSLIRGVFGGTSFSEVSESGNGKVKSGINLIDVTPTSNMSFMSTHICPFNGQCPADILSDCGKYKCGQCYYSIKTIDHMPRILAEIRKLNSEVKSYQTQINLLNSESERDESSIDKLDREKNEVAMELAAWIHTYQILQIKYDEFIKSEESHLSHSNYVVAKPFMLHKSFLKTTEESPQATEFLLRMNDAKMFKEYFTPSLKAEILHIRNRILINQQKFAQLLANTESFCLIDELRGLVRDIAEKEGLSKDEVIIHLRKPFENNKLNGIGLRHLQNG
ncbi:hypothetical protein [Pseudoalteromonas sp. bablab_jr010]|uniref:hypothetical protein n=1 Tax=Pseudoalteromonas sp. bablab_jr010 TaxID=2755063 RepID=UPI0018F728B8|nr:hypothetical protein [Pseudoalteromonas sp. bablab_jr010]MCP4049400.1 hypothetical protein [bacterium]|tara:strand:+ start:2743 stop:6012 length:3270 start_codon:yes stop_codon:yes gene_type:complete